MLDDATAQLWESLRRNGRILRSEDSDDWEFAHDMGVTDDLRTLAAAQDLEVVETEEGIWLTATSESRYALRPGDIMRGVPDRDTKALVSLVSLLTLSHLFDPSRITDDLFVTVDRIASHVDSWADSAAADENASEDARRMASIWRSKPLADGTEENASQRANATTKRGIVLYALRFLEEIDFLCGLPDQRWRTSMRARALWPRYAELGAFANALRERGIELGAEDYA